MPVSLSNRSLAMLDAIRIPEASLPDVSVPVFVESRCIFGFFEGAALRRLIRERDDINYIGNTNRIGDRGGVPAFSFVRDAGETLNDYLKSVLSAEGAAPT